MYNERVKQAIHKIKGVCPDARITWHDYAGNCTLQGDWFKLSNKKMCRLYFFVEINGSFMTHRLGQVIKTNDQTHLLYTRVGLGW